MAHNTTAHTELSSQEAETKPQLADAVAVELQAHSSILRTIVILYEMGMWRRLSIDQKLSSEKFLAPLTYEKAPDTPIRCNITTKICGMGVWRNDHTQSTN
jgi:hypothetical protein